MDKIKDQASRVNRLVFSANTGATYKKTLTLTWDILRETGILLWLTICLVFVGIEWFWKNSVALGRQARDWYEDFNQPSVGEPKSAEAMGQSALAAVSAGTESLFSQARKQLGIEDPTEPTSSALSTSPPSGTTAIAPAEPATPPSPAKPSDSTDPNQSSVAPTQHGEAVPPTVVAKYNSPDTPQTPGTKTGLASAARQSQKIEEDGAESSE
jgi:cytoskeletal protein RodZ